MEQTKKYRGVLYVGEGNIDVSSDVAYDVEVEHHPRINVPIMGRKEKGGRFFPMSGNLCEHGKVIANDGKAFYVLPPKDWFRR